MLGRVKKYVSGCLQRNLQAVNDRCLIFESKSFGKSAYPSERSRNFGGPEVSRKLISSHCGSSVLLGSLGVLTWESDREFSSDGAKALRYCSCECVTYFFILADGCCAVMGENLSDRDLLS